ncbi:MAG: hypothetical protein WC516_04490 [Patescibacteria group bacterium]
MVRLENWSLCFRGNDFYMVPERQNISLQGNAYGHPNFEDGKFVVTSKVMDLDISNGRSSTYSGREYILGQANQEWIVWLRENNFTEYLDGIEKLSATLLN